MDHEKLTRTADWILVISFLGFLGLPALGMLNHWGQSSRTAERRSLASRPPLRSLTERGIQPFTKAFEAYFRDAFGFRRWLITAHALVMVKGFHASPLPKKVVVGRSGWLYLRAAVDSYRCTVPLSRHELARAIRIYSERARWLRRMGITYAILIVPNKSTIYSGHHPGWVRSGAAISRLDQMFSALRAHTTIPVVDLRARLRRAKARCRLYYRTDSHWTDCGAFVGYQGIVAALRSHLWGRSPLGFSELRSRVRAAPGGDLARMLGLASHLPEARHLLSPIGGFRARRFPLPYTTPRWKKRLRRFRLIGLRNPAVPKGRLLILGDSFSGVSSLRLFLAEHFRRTLVVLRSPLTMDPQLVLQERPTLVLQELVERQLKWRVRPNHLRGTPSPPLAPR